MNDDFWQSHEPPANWAVRSRSEPAPAPSNHHHDMASGLSPRAMKALAAMRVEIDLLLEEEASFDQAKPALEKAIDRVRQDLLGL